MSLKKSEIFLSTLEVITCKISILVSACVISYIVYVYYKCGNSFTKITPPIITGIVALYVGRKARKITRQQKEIAEDKLALDLFEKRMKFHVALCNYIISLEIFLNSINTYGFDRMYIIKKISDNLEKLQERNNKLTEEKITASFIYPDDQIKKIDEIFSLKNELPIIIVKTNYNLNQKDKIKNTIEDMNKIKNELECFIKNERLKIR